MMPNIDPRQLKKLMDSMGIKSTQIQADRVVIEGAESDIIIDSPQVTAIDAQGNRSFQIQGDVREVSKVKADISDDDIKMVMEKTGSDANKARAALDQTNGDIAGAIMKLKEE